MPSSRSVGSRPGFNVQQAGAICQAEPLELRRSAEHQPAQLRNFV